MLDTFGFPTPQGANYQEFYNAGEGLASATTREWVKPRGASMVRILLIGSGGDGRATGNGGGSGAITQWIGPAIFIPDVLRISIGVNTSIIYQVKNTTGYTLLTADGGGSNGTAAAAATNNYFGAAGIFKSVAGQAGAGAGGSITASTTTFLSGGAGGASTTGGSGGSVACNYGYPTLAGGVTGITGTTGKDGYFLTQPIMFGCGGSGGGGGTVTGGNGGNGGIGCGGGGAGTAGTISGTAGKGGNGAAFIWSW